MSWKNFFRFSLIFSLIFIGKLNAQVCGGSFGAPIFVEDFGRVNNSYQTVSPALVSPAFTNYIYSSVMPPNDGYYTISNTTEYLPWGWQKSLDHTNDPSGTYGNMLVVNADYSPGEFYRRTLSNVVQGSPINASLWAMNINVNNGVINPNITVRFEQPAGNVVYSFDTGDISNNSQGDVNAWKFFKNPTPFFPPTSQPIDVVFINNAPGGIGNDLAIDDIIVYQSLCDTDNDLTPNYLDLDSDGDTCPDAVEGSENVSIEQVWPLNLPIADANYANRGKIKVIYDGITTNTQPNIVSQSAAALGVPQLVNNAGNNLNSITNPSDLAGLADNTDVPGPTTADIGQGVGASTNAAVNACICYNDPNTGTVGADTKHGITLLKRAGATPQPDNWPMERKSAFTALESNTKGFVITRMTTAEINALTGQSGMMVYDTDLKCLKLFNGTAWSCFNTPTCP